MKKWIVMLVLVAMFGALLAGCKHEITGEEAFHVVLGDLVNVEGTPTNPHIHTGTYEGKPCYNIYVTVNNTTLNYVVSMTGEILFKGLGEHSH